MSTTYSTLVIDAEIMREIFPELDNLSATELKALQKTAAKDFLKSELYSLYNIDRTDTAEVAKLDTLIADYEDDFQRALMYLQAHFYFFANDDVDGHNAKRARDCMAMYKGQKAMFPTFTTDDLSTTAMCTVSRG